MAFNDSKSVYDYIMSRKLPEKWTTPQAIKNAYQTVLNTNKFYQPQISQNMAAYADQTPVTGTQAYKKLVDAYTKEYKQNAAVAAAETVKASQAANAGYGDTYSRAATDQAYTGYLADRGVAMPQLMAVAADAVSQNKAGLAAGINAMTNQRDLNRNAAKQMFSSKLSDVTKQRNSQLNAYSTLNNSLLSMYSAKKTAENKAAAARSSGGGGGGYNGGGYYKIDSGGNPTEQKESSPKVTLETLQSLYQEAIKKNPGLTQTIYSPSNYINGKKGDAYDYVDYLEEAVKNYKGYVIAGRKFYNPGPSTTRDHGKGPLKK